MNIEFLASKLNVVVAGYGISLIWCILCIWATSRKVKGLEYMLNEVNWKTIANEKKIRTCMEEIDKR